MGLWGVLWGCGTCYGAGVVPVGLWVFLWGALWGWPFANPPFTPQAAHWVLPHSPALARFYLSSQRCAARRLVLRM